MDHAAAAVDLFSPDGHIAACAAGLDPVRMGILDTWSAACVDAHAFPVDPRKRAAG